MGRSDLWGAWNCEVVWTFVVVGVVELSES